MNTITRAALALTVIIATSCEIETSDNGNLDGLWYLEAADTLSNYRSTDFQGKEVMWAFQKDLMNARYNSDARGGYLMRFNHRADSLILSEPYMNSREQGDPQVTDPAVLAPFGINGLTDRYLVEHLSGSRMTLKSKILRLKFRKL